jgi:hypothetical protein
MNATVGLMQTLDSRGNDALASFGGMAGSGISASGRDVDRLMLREWMHGMPGLAAYVVLRGIDSFNTGSDRRELAGDAPPSGFRKRGVSPSKRSAQTEPTPGNAEAVTTRDRSMRLAARGAAGLGIRRVRRGGSASPTIRPMTTHATSHCPEVRARRVRRSVWPAVALRCRCTGCPGDAERHATVRRDVARRTVALRVSVHRRRGQSEPRLPRPERDLLGDAVRARHGRLAAGARHVSVGALHGDHPVRPRWRTIAQLSDLDIAPDPGSANPFAVADPPLGSGRLWTIEIVPSGTAGSSANVLSLDAGQRAGWIVYRVYLGNPPGDLAGGAPLPSIVRRRGARSTVLEPCATFLPGTGIATLLRATLPEPLLVTAAPKFVRLANDSGLFANEANAYLSAFADGSPGEILVVRGTLPTTPDTEAGQSVVGDFALRYLSVTSNLNEQPYPTVDGVYDHELPLDALGRYTVVVARDGDVPRNATAQNDVAVLQWGYGNSQAVIIRNMLPSSSFPHAVQDVTPSSYGAPSDAAPVMDAYYPRIAACTRARFEAEGADGCLADD